ncbi:putative DNA repair exonuclease SIA1 [Xylogone sp. PMI_703]|nr:putative DNA repair exonuclease SIA1 [Xylogone sp. PMI_703]
MLSRYLLFLLPLVRDAAALPQLERRGCAHDNCLRALIRSSKAALPFCYTYTTAVQTATTSLPPYATACAAKPARISSACSCLPAAVSTTITSLPTTPASATTTSSTPTSTAPVLRFTKDGTFHLAVFNDLHYGEAENTDWGPEQDVYSEMVMNNVLDKETPQLVVLNGDLITGENTFLENSTLYVDEVVRPLVQRNLLWASTYGNHDSDFNLSREGILERERLHPNSLTGNMVPGRDAGVSNYYLPIYPSDETKDVPAFIMWFFDSRGGNYYQELDQNGNVVTQPSWVDVSVVNWFIETREELTSKWGLLPSIAFYHIPVAAMQAFQTEDNNNGVSPTEEPGINDDIPLAIQGFSAGQGTSNPGFVYDGQDIPFMEALLSTPGLAATFSGHDHGNDWCFKWQTQLPGMNITGNGIDLCFGRHSGYGGYSNWIRGSRQILLNETTLGQSIESWVRLEDGSVSGQITLNSTYGIDQYPVVENIETSLP